METIEKEEKLNADIIWKMFQETDRRFKETEKLLNQKFQETDKQFKETKKLVKRVSRNVGGLNNKFGSFTEGLFMPSLRRIFTKDMGMTNIFPNVYASLGGKNMEIDLLAYSNGEMNIAYIVEIKSHLKIEHIQQILNIIKNFKTFLPEHKGKKLCGMIAAITFTNDLKEEVLSAGLYFAQIHNKTFQIDVPDDFKPKFFN
jgi:hypothetical protein